MREAASATGRRRFPFVSNSDAHSLPKIGREYQQVEADKADFEHVRKALANRDGCRIVAHYGLDPRLGKYHREVAARIKKLSERQSAAASQKGGDREERPPYVHQIPLEFIPGLGPKSLDRLLAVFGTEMNVMHDADEPSLQRIVSPPIAAYIMQARRGETCLEVGGAGKYGKVWESFESVISETGLT